MNIIVTGGASGIGKAVSLKLLNEGHTVIILYNKSEESAKKICREFSSACTYRLDVAKRGDIKDTFAEIGSRFGRIDALVNNAGISLKGCFQDITDDDYDKITAVNFGSVFYCCKYALPFMLHHNSSIVNIASMWGVNGASCEALYSAGKAAVIGFSQALSKELAPSGIRVNCIAPGVIDTNMNASLSAAEKAELVERTPLGRIGTPDDIAQSVSFLIGESSSFITGQTLIVDGGFLSF